MPIQAQNTRIHLTGMPEYASSCNLPMDLGTLALVYSLTFGDFYTAVEVETVPLIVSFIIDKNNFILIVGVFQKLK
jgi:hypothetical protein